MKVVSLVAAALFTGAASAYAEEAANNAVGAAELDLAVAIFTGNIGLTIGLALCFIGLFKFFAQEDTKGGITFIVIGVLLTMLPGVFNGFRLIMKPIVESLGGHMGS